MKRSILLAILLFVGCCSFAQSNNKSGPAISAENAQRLAGQPVKMVENTVETTGGVTTHLCSYVTTIHNPETQQLGNVYYMDEVYKDAKAAQKVMADFLVQNKGVRKHAGIGDEAYSLTDGKNFQLLMFRKGSKLVRIKTNQVKGFKGKVDILVGVGKSIAAGM